MVFFLIFEQERIRSLAKWSVHSLWLAFSFQFWLKGPWKYVCSLTNNDKKGGGGVGKEEKVGENERRCSLLSLHTFQSLAPICSSKQCAVQGSALPGCSPFGMESCFPLQSWGLRSHSLLVEVIFVPCLNLCACAFLLAQLSRFGLLLVEA